MGGPGSGRKKISGSARHGNTKALRKLKEQNNRKLVSKAKKQGGIVKDSFMKTKKKNKKMWGGT